MNEQQIKELMLVYKNIDEKLNRIIKITDHNKTKYTYEVKKECLQLGKEIDLVLAKAYRLDIDNKEKMILEWYHEQTQIMIKVIKQSVSF